MNTKFDIGDEVYAASCAGEILENGSFEIRPGVVKDKIHSIEIFKSHIYYIFISISNRKESELFTTEEEAKKCIKKNILKSFSDFFKRNSDIKSIDP